MELIKKIFGGNADTKMATCEKCGKEKPADEGKHALGGSAFCCDTCCGEKTETAEKKEDGTAKNVCEFC